EHPMDERELSERLTRPRERNKGMTAEEALSLEATLRAIQALDVDKLLEEREKESVSQEALVRRLEAGKGLRTRIGRKQNKKPGRKPDHWKTKRRKKRAKDKKYRDTRRKWLRNQEMAKAAVD